MAPGDDPTRGPDARDEADRLRAQLDRKDREIQQLRERQHRLLGMAAHDLRNPLGSIRGFATFLQDSIGDDIGERDRMLLDRIVSSSQHMLELVDELLTVSETQAGVVQLEPRPTNLCDVVQRAAEVNRAFADTKDIAIVTRDCPPTVTVDVDPAKIEQVIDNLLSNAVKFSEPGATVHVSVTTDDDGVTLAVADEGQGIPAHEFGALFEPFRRTSVRPTAGERSTGLGLTIVRTIVEAHGGSIEVESDVGVGSTFRVRLPCSRPGA